VTFHFTELNKSFITNGFKTKNLHFFPTQDYYAELSGSALDSAHQVWDLPQSFVRR